MSLLIAIKSINLCLNHSILQTLVYKCTKIFKFVLGSLKNMNTYHF